MRDGTQKKKKMLFLFLFLLFLTIVCGQSARIVYTIPGAEGAFYPMQQQVEAGPVLKISPHSGRLGVMWTRLAREAGNDEKKQREQDIILTMIPDPSSGSAFNPTSIIDLKLNVNAREDVLPADKYPQYRHHYDFDFGEDDRVAAFWKGLTSKTFRTLVRPDFTLSPQLLEEDCNTQESVAVDDRVRSYGPPLTDVKVNYGKPAATVNLQAPKNPATGESLDMPGFFHVVKGVHWWKDSQFCRAGFTDGHQGQEEELQDENSFTNVLDSCNRPVASHSMVRQPMFHKPSKKFITLAAQDQERAGLVVSINGKKSRDLAKGVWWSGSNGVTADMYRNRPFFTPFLETSSPAVALSFIAMPMTFQEEMHELRTIKIESLTSSMSYYGLPTSISDGALTSTPNAQEQLPRAAHLGSGRHLVGYSTVTNVNPSRLTWSKSAKTEGASYHFIITSGDGANVEKRVSVDPAQLGSLNHECLLRASNWHLHPGNNKIYAACATANKEVHIIEISET